jgi:hypothetical protein
MMRETHVIVLILRDISTATVVWGKTDEWRGRRVATIATDRDLDNQRLRQPPRLLSIILRHRSAHRILSLQHSSFGPHWARAYSSWKFLI